MPSKALNLAKFFRPTEDGKIDPTLIDFTGSGKTSGMLSVQNISNLGSGTEGQTAFVTSTKSLYLHDGTKWNRVSSGINSAPIFKTNQPPDTLSLAIDGNPTTLNATAVDPEYDSAVFPIEYSWEITDSSGVHTNTSGTFPAQITNISGFEYTGDYVITPSSDPSNYGTLTFKAIASDGSASTTKNVTITLDNTAPAAITGVNSTYDLATDGTATTITAISSDPEGSALTWSYTVTTGSLGSTATVSQADNVFTVTPSTTEADAGTFSITFSVTDGTNITTKVVDFALVFTAAPSSILYTNSGSSNKDFTFTVPVGITSISMVLVGGGGGGARGSSTYGSGTNTSWTPTAGGGGGLKWVSDFTVTPGATHSIRVGRKGAKDFNNWGNQTGTQEGGTSWFGQSGTVSGDDGTSYISAMGGGKGTTTMNSNLSTTAGDPSMGGSNTISAAAIALASSHGGGNGGNGAWRNITQNPNGGGGAAGYSGNGGKGRNWGGTSGNYGEPISATSYYGTGGGGAGGLGDIVNPGSYSNQSGGGVGVYGEGSSGTSYGAVGSGGDYGGGGHAGPGQYSYPGPAAAGDGGEGAVRIMWGAGRSYPSTNVDNTHNTDTETVY